MSKYLNYLKNNHANDLKIFSRWCEDHHRELLPVDFDYKAIMAADNESIINNSVLVKSRMSMSPELNSAFSAYTKDPINNIALRPGETLIYGMDESSSVASPIDPDVLQNAFSNFSSSTDEGNTFQGFNKYPKVPDFVGISGSTDNSKQKAFLEEVIKLKVHTKDMMQGENCTIYDGKIISSKEVVRNMKNINNINNNSEDNPVDSNKHKPK